MIDFKVGDGVKRVKDTSEIMEMIETLHHTVEGYQHALLNSQFELDGTNNWSIYNNTKSLSELSDAQRGLLFNHWCNGGDRLINVNGKFIVCQILRQWDTNCIYRAKQKTEREVFIDEWSSKIATNEYNGGSVRSLVGQMFDDLKVS